ncbi:MAG: M48 family metalloprotease [Saccharofermentans sp.]|nr:M48 family metalloprotease [Saccharofermentans sp.]
MYIVDLFRRVTRKSNIPVFIYLVLNTFVICSIFVLLFTINDFMETWQAILCGLGAYLFSLMIALSPIGEFFLRVFNGCDRIERLDHQAFIMPIFNEVYAKARQNDPGISDKVELFISEDESANAFALGRKTICITQGMMNRPVEEIKAVLAHEFGHISHKDTDLILLVTMGNFFVTAFITIVKILIGIIRFIAFCDRSGSTAFIASTLSLILVDFVMFIWTTIGTLIVFKSSRANEYEADMFAYKLGYGNALCAFLDSSACKSTGRPKGLFGRLMSSHPKTNSRIARLQVVTNNF